MECERPRSKDSANMKGDGHLKGPLSTLTAFSYIPPRRTDPKELTYFNNERKKWVYSAYDGVFKRKDGYNEKLHRDDREHAKSRGLNVYSEEISKCVPALSSSVYGKHSHRHSDDTDRNFVRVGRVRVEFFRKNGVFYIEQGYGAVPSK
uniref:Uncharacterized protein n=1 Tax=Latimeria chalumnae TaxID=7897 RepID=H2ZY79_LATCH